MSDFADLRLDKPEAPDGAPEGGRPGARGVVALCIVVALVAAGVYLLWPKHAAEPAPVVPATAPAQSRSLTAEPGDNIPLPALDDTDPLVRQLVSQLSSHPKVAAWLTTRGLIRNFAVVIQNIGGHELHTKHLQSVKPSGTFPVIKEGGRTYLDPAGYRRYDAYADAFAAIDARGAAKLYATLKPRISEAFRDLGDPRGDADAAVRRAIVELLATPVVEARVPLKQPTLMYTFDDPALEALSPAQRQLLRMGPRNTRIVQDKLREIAPLLGIGVPPAASR